MIIKQIIGIQTPIYTASLTLLFVAVVCISVSLSLSSISFQQKKTKMKEKNEYNYLYKFILLILLVIILWFTSWFIVDNLYSSIADRGAFGDKFGFINSLFSGLALAGIIYSIFLQQKELSLQRKELKETKEEFKDQNFQTTFFNLLKSQNQIVNDISTSIPAILTLV